MAELSFACTGAHAERYAATPTVMLRLRVREAGGALVHTALLRCQLRLEPKRRRYSPAESDRLRDVFGDPSRYVDTIKPIQLATVATVVPRFTGTVEFDLPVPFSYDLEVASGAYLRGLEEGRIPLLLLFSGTVFLDGPRGYSIEQVPWTAETPFDLPLEVWREAVERYFPHSAWLRLDLDTLDALRAFKSEHALPTWDAVLTALLDRSTGATSALVDSRTEQRP